MRIILKFILLILSLSTLSLVSCNELLVRTLLSAKTGLVTQMEHQIGQTRSVISSSLTNEFNNFVADVQEAHKFARVETESFAKYMEGASAECLANLPTNIEEILSNADEHLNQCMQTAIVAGSELDRKYATILEDYRANSTAYNLLFARDFFKRPEDVFKVALFAELYKEYSDKAIIWDNVESLNLYSMRQIPRDELQTINDSLYKCIMDMKEMIGTELGRIFLYFWDC